MVEKSSMYSLWPALTDPLRMFGQRLADWVAPASEASADSDNYRIAIEVPGVSEDDIEVTLDDGVLTLKGEKSSTREDKGETWFFSERQFGAFQRSFRLPPDADAEKVAAAMKDGVLTVTVPKRVGTADKSRKVAISRS
jgi:HSP20 family protein